MTAKTRCVMTPTEQSPKLLESVVEVLPCHDLSPRPPLLGTKTDDEVRIIDEELTWIAKYFSVDKAKGLNTRKRLLVTSYRRSTVV